MSISENIRNFALQSIIMRDLEPFKIDLKALTDQVATYEFELDDAYFEAIEAPDAVSYTHLTLPTTPYV